MLGQIFGASVTNDRALDQVFWVEPRVPSVTRILTSAFRADLLAVRELGEVTVVGSWAEIRAPHGELCVAPIVGALLKIEAGLKARSNESPYR